MLTKCRAVDRKIKESKDVDTQFNQKIENLEDLECDAIILACGMGAKHFYPELPIKPVRGQVTYVQSEGNLQNLKCTIGYGGYVGYIGYVDRYFF